ncbi:MAG TPA: hypothetical protein VGF59_08715 [Bryobacteraceae bacterium]|jgi:hypothetical protein
MTHRISITFLALCTAAIGAHAEQSLLDQGYRQMYNLQFAEAHQTFHEFERQHPEDAMGPVSDAAAYLFAEFDRLHILQSEFFTHDQHFITDHKLTPDPAVKRNFEACLAAAEKLAGRTPQTSNSRLAAILAKGLHSDYLALIEKRYSASLQEMKTARSMAERLVASDPNLYDAWIAVGVENYMLGVKPLVTRWFLKLGGARTDAAEGIAKLQLTAEKGRYLAPFAKLLLAVAALRDHNENRARDLLGGLAREFPKNHLYAQELERLNTMARANPTR